MSSDHELTAFAARLRQFIIGNAPPSIRFEQLALELFALQFHRNKPYRRFCEARSVRPATVTEYPKIPAIPTLAFKELQLSCIPTNKRTAVFHSSGTTEQRPSRHFHSAESLAVYEASLWHWFAHHLPATPGFELLILTPAPEKAPHSSLVHMFDTIRQKLQLSDSVFVGKPAADGWTLDLDATLEALRNAHNHKKPLGVLGTAFSFVQLLDHLAEHRSGFQLPPGSWALETGGYKGRSRALPKHELHALITRQLGVPTNRIFCEYGMSELSSQAYDLRIGAELQDASQTIRSFRFPPWARAQIISPENGQEVCDGETGLIRIFDLANVYSVMAIQTEDLAVRRGNGFELLGRAAAADPRGCSLMAVNPEHRS